MTNSLNAYFGRNTYAFLSECAICNKPYQGGNWHTFESKMPDASFYFIVCDECDKKQAVNDAKRIHN